MFTYKIGTEMFYFSDLPYWLGLHQYTDIYNCNSEYQSKTNHHKIRPWKPTNSKVNKASMDNTLPPQKKNNKEKN